MQLVALKNTFWFPLQLHSQKADLSVFMSYKQWQQQACPDTSITFECPLETDCTLVCLACGDSVFSVFFVSLYLFFTKLLSIVWSCALSLRNGFPAVSVHYGFMATIFNCLLAIHQTITLNYTFLHTHMHTHPHTCIYAASSATVIIKSSDHTVL